MLSAEGAKELGLIDGIVQPEELHAHVQAYALELTSKPAEGLAAIRRTINTAQWASFEDSMAEEKAEAVRLSQSEAFREGVTAFLKKRP